MAAYGAPYQEAFDETVPVAELVPAMLAAFLESDRNFCRGRQSPRKGRGG
ncbi:MAG: DUF2274 domain-containing protein [Sphingosinicella sp.]